MQALTSEIEKSLDRKLGLLKEKLIQKRTDSIQKELKELKHHSSKSQ